jgi:lysophospholipase L1-like esterase
MTVTTEAGDRHCLRPGEAESLLAHAPWRRLLAMGDSIVVHRGDPVAGYRPQPWPDRLRTAFGRRRDATPAYLNVGVSGARTAEIRAGQLDEALRFRPDLAILAAGANDAVRRSFDPQAVAADLEAMIGALSRAGALVVTLGCFDLAPGLRVLSALTARLTERHGGVHVDFGKHPAPLGSVLSADRLHINARGHAVVAADVIRALAVRIG